MPDWGIKTMTHPGAALHLPDSKKIYRERAAQRAGREARREQRLQDKQRRLENAAFKRADQDAVLRSVRDGAETWAQIAATVAPALDASRLRSALRALLRKGRIRKLSKRRYGLI